MPKWWEEASNANKLYLLLSISIRTVGGQRKYDFQTHLKFSHCLCFQNSLFLRVPCYKIFLKKKNKISKTLSTFKLQISNYTQESWYIQFEVWNNEFINIFLGKLDIVHFNKYATYFSNYSFISCTWHRFLENFVCTYV